MSNGYDVDAVNNGTDSLIHDIEKLQVENDTLKAEIEKLKSNQPVRCGECKYGIYEPTSPKYVDCNSNKTLNWHSLNDYCSCGKRKESEEK